MTRKLDDWIEGFITWQKDSEAPYLYRVWVAHSVIAAVLQRKCSINIGYETFYPNLYVVLVGPSGSRKGTAMVPGLEILREVSGVKLAAEAITREALIKQLRLSSYTQIDPETGKTYFHCSLTVFSEELTVFLGYHNLQLMSDLCNWYDCPNLWIYRTKGQGTDEIRGVWLNLIGATTPELLLSTLPRDAVGGGLFSRIMCVFEEKKGQTKSLFSQIKDDDLRDDLIHDLEVIGQIRGEFTHTEEFQYTFDHWYYEQDANPPFTDPRLAGYVSKRATHLIKTIMITSASRSSSMTVDKPDFDTALSLLESTEIKMPKTFSGFGKSETADVLSRVATTIATQGDILWSDLLGMYHYDVDKNGMKDIVATLHAMKFCSIIPQGNDNIIRHIPEKTLER